jgi:hypothetical protein
LGTVSPFLSGTNLKVGKAYELVAIPNPNRVFAGWSGDVTCDTERLTFVMQSNMVLRANFAPHAFAGSYNGLFYEADEVRHASSGFFTTRVDTNLVFSAKLVLEGMTNSFTGQFGADGGVTLTVLRPGTNALTVNLLLDPQNAPDQITGQVTDGAWVASLLADRAIYDAASDYGVFRGRYTLAIPDDAFSDAGPSGTGYGGVTVGPKGVATLIGESAEAKPISQATSLSRNGEWPLYIPLYGGKGSMLGWITFTNRESDDLTGALKWIKPIKPLAKYYPGGFTNETVVTGSRYDTNLLGNLASAVVVLGGGNLSGVFTNAVTWVPTNSVLQAGGSPLPVAFDSGTGIFRGLFVDPGTGNTNAFRGVVLTKQSCGAGFVRGTNLCGYMFLQPAP